MANISGDAYVRLLRWGHLLGGVPRASIAVFRGGRLLMTDGIAGVDTVLEDVEDLSGCAVPLQRLFMSDFVNSGVVLARAGAQVVLTAGNFRAQLPTQAEDALPPWPAPPARTAAAWVSVSPEWWAAVGAVAFALPEKAVVQPRLGGVSWRGRAVLGADGLRAVRAASPLAGEGFFPKKILEIAGPASAPPEEVGREENRVWFRFGDGTFVWSLLPAEPFPEGMWRGVSDLSKEAGSTAWASWDDGDAVSLAAERVGWFAGGHLTFRTEGKTHIAFAVEGSVGSAAERVEARVARGYSVVGKPALLADAARRAPACALAEKSHALVFRRKGFELIVMLMVGL